MFFFDIGIPDILFRIEGATEWLYYSVVAVKKDETGKYQFATDWKTVKIKMNPHFKEQPWGRINWFSKPVVSVFHDMNLSSHDYPQLPTMRYSKII
ncbi:MAG: hypothetical protein EXR80_00610 [Methylococcales bacterium]|nr:hypothetical protein [Methylococcales bacterium]